jgi:hypothetical protein
MSITALARARSACNVMMVGNTGMEFAANPHTEIAVFDKAKERIHDHPSMQSDGASDSATGGQPRPLCPRTATASLHTSGDGGAADQVSKINYSRLQ